MCKRITMKVDSAGITAPVHSSVGGLRTLLTRACNARCKNGACKENQLVPAKEIICQCNKGWEGQFCDIPTGCELDCGTGKCLIQNGVQLCECPFGYEGNLCENRLNSKTADPDLEESFPSHTAPNLSVLDQNVKNRASQCAGNFVCQNGGYCSRALLGYKCQCEFPYTGVFCEEVCDKTCVNGGKCFRQVHLDDTFDVTGVTLRCNCPVGFQGEFCEHTLTDIKPHQKKHFLRFHVKSRS